ALAALKGAEQFKGQSSIQTWVIGILRDKILDHLRGQFGKLATEISISESDPEDDLFDAGGRWVRPPVAWRGDPYDAVREAEFRQVLAGCLESVPSDKRAVLLLRVDGMPSGEICKQLAITPTNLWVILHRVRAMLRRCLEDKWFTKK
ncbi:MAG: sigma-70 family RNA polymerase sigma factor, partial [Acidobacteria bacterium]|nr:sigma-70 family RNA polymerase sigma factor [Acidobacteriota bacterium]